MGTAQRRLEIMKQLCRERHITMTALAKQYGVSVRTIQRDIFELTFMMPIYVKTGKYDGGVYVAGDYTMDRVYMTSQEVELLKKVKNMVSGKLSFKEQEVFENIINIYTKPIGDKNKLDNNCLQ